MFSSAEPVKVDDDRARAHEMDCTPTPVVEQLFAYLREYGYATDGMHYLDPSAGAGVFGMVASRMFPSSLRCAIEPRGEEMENITKYYGKIQCGTLQSAQEMLDGLGPFDLIATNPPFSHAVDFVRRLLPHLTKTGELWLLQLDDFGQRSREGHDLFANWETRPTCQLRIAGSLGFRSDGKTDSRSYSWWGWCREDQGKHRNGWHCVNLPRLPAKDRKWTTIRPGEEWMHES